MGHDRRVFASVAAYEESARHRTEEANGENRENRDLDSASGIASKTAGEDKSSEARQGGDDNHETIPEMRKHNPCLGFS